MSVPTVTSPTTTEANNPVVFKVLPDGTVLYKTWQDAKTARQQQSMNQSKTKVKTLSQVKSGEQYLTKDGTIAPYTLGSLVEFQFTGLIVVIVVLAGLSLVCAAIGRLMKKLVGDGAVVPAIAAVQPSASMACVSGGIHPGLTDQQLVVLLTAAASELLDGPVRVDKFRPLTSKDLNWSAQGRSVLQSHRLK